MMIEYGWLKDTYDKRDYLHKKLVVALPERFSLSQYLTAVRDQGNIGACVGFGIGINLNAIKKALRIFQEWASPTWIYNGARFIEGTLPFDIGCRPRDALKWISENGILLEHFWPYDPEHLDRRAPSSEHISQATRYQGFEYFRAIDGIDGICDAIASQHFVSIGTPWFQEWVESPAGGMLPKPTTNSIFAGGHETCLFGYDRGKGLFFGVNSWGTTWGDHGMFQMPFEAIDVFKFFGGYDAHYMVHTALLDTGPTVSCFFKRLVRRWLD